MSKNSNDDPSWKMSVTSDDDDMSTVAMMDEVPDGDEASTSVTPQHGKKHSPNVPTQRKSLPSDNNNKMPPPKSRRPVNLDDLAVSVRRSHGLFLADISVWYRMLT